MIIVKEEREKVSTREKKTRDNCIEEKRTLMRKEKKTEKRPTGRSTRKLYIMIGMHTDDMRICLSYSFFFSV
jgi:hypothetical protein